MQKRFKIAAVIALMLVLFIDGMGQGIIFPILTTTITNTHSTLFFHGNALNLRYFWYGLLIGIYYFMWFISAPLLGDWSDSVGRKKSLLICLSLAAVSFILSAVAFDIGSLSLLLIARLLGGITSGDQAIAKAAVIDICPNNQKSIYLGLVLGAVTLGLVTGPLIGSMLQNSNLISWFSIKTPFYVACLIAVVNIFLIHYFFRENDKPLSANKNNIRWTKAISFIKEAFIHKEVQLLMASYFLTQLGWQTFYIDLPDFVVKKFSIGSTQQGTLLALIGVGIGLGLSVLPYLFRNMKHKHVAIVGYLGLFLGILLTLMTNKIIFLYFSLIPMASFFGLAAVNVLSLFSNKTSPERQGWMMGVTGSVVALTGGLGSLTTGLISSIDMNMPFWLSLIAILFGLIMLFFIDNNH